MTGAGHQAEADPGTGTLVTLAGLFVAGWSAAFVFLRHVGELAHPAVDAAAEVGLFEAVLAVVCGTALAGSVWFARVWWCDLWPTSGGSRRRVRVTTLAGTGLLLGVLLVGLRVLTATSPPGLDHDVADATAPVTAAVAVCVLPGLAALVLVRAVARDDVRWPTAGLDLARALMRARRQERRVLTVLGLVLTLLVVSTGLRRQALLALDPGLREPAAAIALYGLVFAALLGGLHVLAEQALDRRVGAAVERLPAAVADDLSDLADVVARRAALAAALGGGGSAQSFRSAVVVAAPLLTAVVGGALAR